MSTVPIDDAKMLEIVGRLVEAVNPDRITLFGSRARGDAGPDSDLDLLIVKDRMYRGIGERFQPITH